MFSTCLLRPVGRLFTALGLVALWAAVAVPDLRAQTPVTKIVNSAGDSVLVSYEGGGLAAFGELGSTPIPAEGGGARLMWYPGKAAVRGGRVQSGRWDDSFVGAHSVAFGFDTKASGTYSAALNYATTAEGDNATAMGDLTSAGGIGSLAMGYSTTASGRQSTAMGYLTTAATDQSLSTGRFNSANQTDDGTLLVVGNGSSGSRSDALVLDQSGDLTISGTLTESSDRRLKTQVEPMGAGTLQKLADLRPVRYRFENQDTHPSGPQIGLVAQDVRQEFPALVSEGAGGYLSLAYPKLTAILVKGIQEQQTELESREKEIDHLEERLAALEATVSAEDPAVAGLGGPWPLAALLALGLGGLAGALLWRRFA